MKQYLLALTHSRWFWLAVGIGIGAVWYWGLDTFFRVILPLIIPASPNFHEVTI